MTYTTRPSDRGFGPTLAPWVCSVGLGLLLSGVLLQHGRLAVVGVWCVLTALVLAD